MKQKSRLISLVFLLFFIFPKTAFSNESMELLDNQVVSFFLNTKNFHKSIATLLERDSYFYPLGYIVSLQSSRDGILYKHYFDINYYSEFTPTRDFLLATVPYYSLSSLDNGFSVDFSFVFPMEEAQNIHVINDEILKLAMSGTIESLAQSSGFLRKSAFFHPKYKVDRVVIWEVGIILFLVFLNILLISKYWKTMHTINQTLVRKKRPGILECREIASEKALAVQQSITEPVTGLFTADYLKSRIQNEISKYQSFSRIFSVAFFIIQDKGDVFETRTAADIIKENLNSNVISAYKGSGVFLSLFPERKESDIAIFVDLVVEKIYAQNIPIVSRIQEYYGQEDFLSGELG